MKVNQRNRSARNNNRGNALKTQGFNKNTVWDSSSINGKLRGTAAQLYERYLSLEKDMLLQNDRVLAQVCAQYADHYLRLHNISIAAEQAIRAEAQKAELKHTAQTASVELTETVAPEENTKDTPESETTDCTAVASTEKTIAGAKSNSLGSDLEEVLPPEISTISSESSEHAEQKKNFRRHKKTLSLNKKQPSVAENVPSA